MGRIELIGAEHPAWRDDVDGQIALEHRSKLNRRGLRAEHNAAALAVHKERVLHRARRVVGRDIERVEVEPFGFSFGTLGDLVAHSDEDLGHPLHQGVQRVAPTPRHSVGGQRDVDSLLDEDTRVALGFEGGEPAVQRLADGLSRAADALARFGLGRGRQRTDLAIGQGEGRPVPRVRQAHGLELIQVTRCGDRRERSGHHVVDRGWLE